MYKTLNNQEIIFILLFLFFLRSFKRLTKIDRIDSGILKIKRIG